ncbi:MULTISPECIES: dienelactone hydrolase family protein [unclassified Streptomyces]|uniref:dienelactone hydrolase family protein n=1 Tax=unclassified Streptomyces TaxID=2593676 RepID=UPI00109E9F55|nr:dienelactone hydrolase family protein [Streptomyces sp. A1136]THA57981.1 dienelactone hydrolase family protein [Streptomyces sp. A1136]
MAYEIVARDVAIQVGDSASMSAYLARPAGGGSHPTVLVCAELWGVTEEVRAVVRRVAELGYVAIVPNLYHRCDPETAGGLEESDANRERAFELLGRLTRDEVETDLRACTDYVREHAGADGKCGILGFSLGGHIAYFAASRLDLDAAAIFYPGWLPVAGTALSRPEPLLEATGAIADRDVRMLLFFAELDHVIDADQRGRIGDALAAAGVRHETVVYPEVQHAFFFPGRGVYDKDAAEDSWARVREFFATRLAR